MKKILIYGFALVFILCAWLFYEYKQVAGFAEEQVESDILWLRLSFETSAKNGQADFVNRKHLETHLVQQSVDEHNRFLRHYGSLFIQEGEKQCLMTQVSYLNFNPSIEKQQWVDLESGCVK